MENLPAARWKHIAVVLNRESGTLANLGPDTVVAGLMEIFGKEGCTVDVQSVPAREVQGALEKARDGEAEVVIVGGGDGTIASAATIFAGQTKPLGFLPLGTFNLAARDVGMPLDWQVAARTLLEAPTGQMDLLELQGKLYLCVIVLGFYPTLALGRPEYHGNWLVKAWRTLTQALQDVTTFPPLDLKMRDEQGREVNQRTRIVLLANNDYEDVFGLLPQRKSLDAGYFTMYVSKHRTRWGLLRAFFAWLIGRWKQDREITVMHASELTIHARRRKRLAVMRDGEIDKLPLPLQIRLLPKALWVIAPRLAVQPEGLLQPMPA